MQDRISTSNLELIRRVILHGELVETNGEPEEELEDPEGLEEHRCRIEGQYPYVPTESSRNSCSIGQVASEALRRAHNLHIILRIGRTYERSFPKIRHFPVNGA